jgi:enoyl-[acyl-carrier-protein] reductase (NADH)
MLLRDKVCLIVGAASLRSIGYATAELIAEHGAKVVLADVVMDEQVLSALNSAIEARVKGPTAVHCFRCDISQAQDCDALVATSWRCMAPSIAWSIRPVLFARNPSWESVKKSLISCSISTLRERFSCAKACSKCFQKTVRDQKYRSGVWRVGDSCQCDLPSHDSNPHVGRFGRGASTRNH